MLDAIQRNAAIHGEKEAYSFLDENGVTAAKLTYGELLLRAQALAEWLLEGRLGGERVLLIFPQGLEFVSAFFGCLFAGAVAVPVYPPSRSAHLARLLSVVGDAEPSIVLTSPSFLGRVEKWARQAPALAGIPIVSTEAIELQGHGDLRLPPLDEARIALLQYTSGSTGKPRGVEVTYGNLTLNQEMIKKAFEQSTESVTVSWLPFYHDMGLIGGILQPVYSGGRLILLSPTSFLRRPSIWLETISRYRATTSGGPNFAYDLCVSKVSESDRLGLDLSSWRVAFNGAEPVRRETLARFAQSFAPVGFRREAFYLCYGLAEATLFVTGGTVGREAANLLISKAALDHHRVEIAGEDSNEGPPAGPRTDRAHWAVSCGRTRSGQRLFITDPESREPCPEGQVGEIWVAGKSVGRGYWRRPEESERVFGACLSNGDGPFLRTGDLGFLHGGELYVTGRLKDLVIIRGRNLYPHDIERTAEGSHEELSPGSCAAFSVDSGDGERLVLVQEVKRRARTAPHEIVAGIQRAVADVHEVSPHEIVLVREATIPKTSSGKIQRLACRSRYLEGSLKEVARSTAAPVALAAEPSADAPSIIWDRGALAAAPAAHRRTVLVRGLTREVERILKIDASQIDAHRPLSALGLDSLTAIELQVAVEERLQVALPWADLLAGLTLDDLAFRLEDALASAPSAAPRRSPAAADEESPLSAGQEALWLLHRLAPRSSAYSLVHAFSVDGDLDVGSLRRAVAALRDRHPVLRTSFFDRGGRPLQQVHPPGGDLPFQVIDAAIVDAKELARHLGDEVRRPFDLERGALLRVHLWRSSSRKHVLSVSLHHIVTDFRSLELMLEELETLYDAGRSRIPRRLPPSGPAFTEFARRQRRELAGERGALLRKFWDEQLSGAPMILDIPTDRPRPPLGTDRRGALTFAVDRETKRKVDALARRAAATPFMLLLAAYYLLLARLTGKRDVLVGSPVAGRDSAEWARTLGYFVNPLVLRGDLGGDPTFIELLERTRRTVLGAFRHGDYPLSALVDQLRPDRDASRSPLFQVMFTFHKERLQKGGGLVALALGAGGTRLPWAGLTLESLALEPAAVQFDQTLTVGEIDGALAVSLEYASELFEGTTVLRQAKYFRTLLRDAVERPGRRISEIRMLSAPERHQSLAEWNDSERDVDAFRGVHDMVAERARERPEGIALLAPEGTLSFGELQTRAEKAAAWLVVHGVGPADRVGICLGPSLDMLPAILAVLSAGGVWVPLDPDVSPDRLRLQLNEGGVGLLVTREERSAGLEQTVSRRVVGVERLVGHTGPSAGERLGRPVAGGELACLVYTSGSTGRPKAVALQHHSLANLTASFALSYRPGAADRLLPLTSVASASFVGEIFAVVCAGGVLVLPARADVLTIADLPRFLARHRITILSTVPSLAARLEAPGPECGGLRLLLVGGEALMANQVEHLLGSTKVVNGYGLTEATICSSFHVIRPEDRRSKGALPVGRPLINSELYVLGRSLEPLPVRCPGDLCVGGAGLARGYFGHPGATAVRLVPHPRGVGERLFRTGDVARLRLDGEVEYLGRRDQQIKLRGHRIEIGEIEAALGLHPAVRDVAVTLWSGDSRGGQDSAYRHLVAYFCLRHRRTATPGELREYLADRLPGYMVPSFFHELEALPLTGNGKVDLVALPAPRAPEPAGAAPRSGLERQLAGVWRQVLGLSQVGVDENFFETGGNSLLMSEVHARLRRDLAADLSLVDLYRYPTIRTLAHHLRLRDEVASDSPIAAVKARAERRRTGFAQRRLLVKQKRDAAAPSGVAAASMTRSTE